jgi:uncharacterized protein YecE (DUF72 family)
VTGGLLQLKEKLGPINWQLLPVTPFAAADFAAFLKLLPKTVEGHPLRHAVEVRHPSFRVPEFVELAREHGVAIVIAGDSEYPQIADVTAPFVYARVMGTQAKEPLGYSPEALDVWAQRAKSWARGEAAKGLETVTPHVAGHGGRDVFFYFISGHKVANPAAAQALIERIK